MGSEDIITEIFELEDSDCAKLGCYLIDNKIRRLQIEGSEFAEFDLTKPLARKLVKALIEEFKLGELKNGN